jgi:hypothetical protein
MESPVCGPQNEEIKEGRKEGRKEEEGDNQV